MSLPFIPQSHTSDQSLIGIERSGIWIWASDQWGEGAWRIRVSAAVSCHVKLVLGPVDDAQNPRQRPWCPVPVGTALVCLLSLGCPACAPEQPTTQRPAPGRRNSCSTPASEIVPPFPLWATVSCCPAPIYHPTNRLRASFSLEFLGPRTCETESCIARCLSSASAVVLSLRWLLSSCGSQPYQSLSLPRSLCVSVQSNVVRPASPGPPCSYPPPDWPVSAHSKAVYIGLAEHPAQLLTT